MVFPIRSVELLCPVLIHACMHALFRLHIFSAPEINSPPDHQTFSLIYYNPVAFNHSITPFKIQSIRSSPYVRAIRTNTLFFFLYCTLTHGLLCSHTEVENAPFQSLSHRCLLCLFGHYCCFQRLHSAQTCTCVRSVGPSPLWRREPQMCFELYPSYL